MRDRIEQIVQKMCTCFERSNITLILILCKAHSDKMFNSDREKETLFSL